MSKTQQPVICLIEDDEIMGDSLLDRFDLEGFRVDWHRTGLGAMRAISNKNYDLVISDIHLPDSAAKIFYAPSTKHSPPFIFIPPSVDRPCACQAGRSRLYKQAI
jgi:DNA-binding response OmpR family regulator